MNCERCGERPGTVRYTEVTDGATTKQWICADCARQLGFGQAPPAGTRPPGGAAESEEVEAGDVAPSDAPESPLASPLRADRRCPSCGLTGADFGVQALFGCPHCYEAFDADLDLLLKRLHGSTIHRGRLPRSVRVESAEEVGRLRRDLDEAVARRDFESAARLRDRLRSLERGGPPSRAAGAEGGGA